MPDPEQVDRPIGEFLIPDERREPTAYELARDEIMRQMTNIQQAENPPIQTFETPPPGWVEAVFNAVPETESTIIIPPEITSPPKPDPKPLKIEDVLSKSEIDLLKLAPLNPTVRAIVLARTFLELPEGETDFEKIKVFIEEKCTQPVRRFAVGARNQAIRLNISVRTKHEGRCSYRGEFHAEGEIELTALEIRRMANDIDPDLSGLNSFYDRISARLEDLAHAQLQSTPITIETSDHDSDTYTEDPRLTFDEDQLRNAINEHLRLNFSDLYHRLRAYDDGETEDHDG